MSADILLTPTVRGRLRHAPRDRSAGPRRSRRRTPGRAVHETTEHALNREEVGDTAAARREDAAHAVRDRVDSADADQGPPAVPATGRGPAVPLSPAGTLGRRSGQLSTEGELPTVATTSVIVGLATHLTIWARLVKPSFVRMCSTCASAVLTDTTSRSAICRLDRPAATRPATSRSLFVRFVI
jgi:hypothetical protein